MQSSELYSDITVSKDMLCICCSDSCYGNKTTFDHRYHIIYGISITFNGSGHFSFSG